MVSVWDSKIYKVCKSCGLSYQLTDKYWFTPRSFICLNCKATSQKRASKRYRQNNKKKLASNLKKWRSLNKDHILEFKRNWNSENKDKVKQMREKHYSNDNNRLKKHKQDNNYYINNKKKIKAYQKEWLKTKPHYRFRMRISHLIREQLKKSGFLKNGKSIFDYLDYTLYDLKNHIENLFEPWMTWNNVGFYRLKDWKDEDISTWRWQLDHIIPQSKLPYDSLDHPNFKKCWALDNLRPLSAKENLLKGNR